VSASHGNLIIGVAGMVLLVLGAELTFADQRNFAR